MADHAHTETLSLRVQFDDEAQQKDASTLGMWIFLITEIMFFGGMFAVYTVYRNFYPTVFAIASSSLDEVIGALNTGVLLLSSFTMVMAVRAGQLGRSKAIVWFLILTLLFGGIFLGVKAYEWNEKFKEHHIPGQAAFHLEGVAPGRPGPRPVVLFHLFCDDRSARPAYGDRRRHSTHPDHASQEGQILGVLLYSS